MSTAESQFDSVREELLSLIESSGKGSTRIKTKNLLGKFNFVALQRVRRDSLVWVRRELASWGIECQFPADISVDSFVWLTRSSPIEKAAPLLAVASHALPSSASEEPLPLPPDPLPSFFHINGSVDAATAQSLHYRLTAAVWAGRPVLLLTQASENLFAFVAGYMAALMRRRHLTSRRWQDMGGWPRAPQIVTTAMLKALTGQTASAGEIDHSFPCAGAVYLLRDHPDQADEDDLASFVREAFIPHSYRLEEQRPVGDPALGGESMGRDGAWLALLARWLPALAGAPSHPLAIADRALSPQLATLLAEATHAQDALLDDAALRSLPASFQSGFESTEHMLLKGIMLEYLQRRYPQDRVLVEQVIESLQEVDDEDAAFEKPQKVKPDLHITGKLCVEVETLRDICLKGSNPFFSLEAKLRKKLPALCQFPQIWVLVPSDVAMLGRHQMSALVRDLAQAMGKSEVSVRFGFVDAERRQPVLVTPEAPPRLEIEFCGASWRSPEQKAERPLSLDDIAGYSDLKKIIRSDVLDPLINRERYAKYGLSGANVLLYGLPGCGKSLVGKVLADMASLTCRRLLPSDLSSMWLGQGVEKIRDVFDWAIKQTPCLLIIDEIDGVAPQRSEHNMHSDERRQVNELLAQFDRIAGKDVKVIGTTNYMRGIDTAIRRSGRFDLRVPVFPPTQEDRSAIFSFYLRRHNAGAIAGIDTIDIDALAAQTRLFTPADIEAVVKRALRRAAYEAGQRGEGQVPVLSMVAICKTLREHQRSIQRDDALRWIEEAQSVLGTLDERLRWLTEEVSAAYGE